MAKVQVAEIIGDQLRKAVAQALKDVQPELDRIAKDGGHAAAGGIIGDIGTLSKLISDIALAAVVLDPPVGLAMEAVKAAEDAGGKWAIGSALGYMMGYTAFQSLNPLFVPLQHAVADWLQTGIFDPDTAAMLEVKGIISHRVGRSEAAGGNLSGEHYDKLVEAAKARPPLPELLELLNRGEMTEGEVTANLVRLGYDKPTREILLTLRRNLLSPADLALANLRGHLTDADMLDYAKRLGVDSADMSTLVVNTGEPPGLEQLLEAFRRGFINRERLVRGVRQSRVRNEWEDVVEHLRFSPMSIADAVRGVVEHYLTDKEGETIAQQNGLLPEHWRPLVDSWGRPLAHGEMLSLYHRGLASRGQVDQAFAESDMKDKYAELSFELGRRLLPERLIVQAIKFRAIDLKDGAKRLQMLGYAPEDVSILLKLGLHEQSASQHELTRAQVVALYADAIFTRKQALDHLESLGFSAQDAGYMLQLIDVQQHAKEVKAEVTVVRDNYLAGGITSVQAENELVQLGQTAQQARHIIGVWDREKRRAARTLTEPQIVKAAKAQTIAPAEAISLLEALGYSRANAAILLHSNGVPVAA